MIFGFLLLDIALFAVAPLFLLLFIWADRKWLASFATFGVLVALLYTNWQNITFDAATISEFIKYTLAYLALGFGFTFFKWKMAAIKVRRAFEEHIRGRDLSDRKQVAGMFTSPTRVMTLQPKTISGWEVKYNKATLAEYATAWTVWWPFYAMLLVLDDLIRHLFDWFVETFGNIFRRIANATFASIE